MLAADPYHLFQTHGTLLAIPLIPGAVIIMLSLANRQNIEFLAAKNKARRKSKRLANTGLVIPHELNFRLSVTRPCHRELKRCNTTACGKRSSLGDMYRI